MASALNLFDVLSDIDNILKTQVTKTKWDDPHPAGPREISPEKREAIIRAIASLATMIESGQDHIAIGLKEGIPTHITFNCLAEKGSYLYKDGTIVLSSEGLADYRMRCDKGTWVATSSIKLDIS